MTFPGSLDIVRGIASGFRHNNKFGRNPVVGSIFAPVAVGGIYRTPQVSGATSLRIKAGGNANDTANGAGARSVTLIGLNASGNEISETIATAGASASLPTSQQFIRIYRGFVASSGTYASQSAPSHFGSIIIENAAGTEDWATIQDTDIGRAQTQIAVYSVPKNRQAYISGIKISSDADKKVNLVLFQRQNILETAAPYSAMRLVEEFPQISGLHVVKYDQPLGPFPQLTDVGFMAKAIANTADVAVSFEIIEANPS